MLKMFYGYEETKDFRRGVKLNAMDRDIPGWREMKHTNGAPKFSPTGTLLDDKGNRSIFDDVGE